MNRSKECSSCSSSVDGESVYENNGESVMYDCGSCGAAGEEFLYEGGSKVIKDSGFF